MWLYYIIDKTTGERQFVGLDLSECLVIIGRLRNIPECANCFMGLELIKEA